MRNRDNRRQNRKRNQYRDERVYRPKKRGNRYHGHESSAPSTSSRSPLKKFYKHDSYFPPEQYSKEYTSKSPEYDPDIDGVPLESDDSMEVEDLNIPSHPIRVEVPTTSHVSADSNSPEIPYHCWVGEYLDEGEEKDIVPLAHDSVAQEIVSRKASEMDVHTKAIDSGYGSSSIHQKTDYESHTQKYVSRHHRTESPYRELNINEQIENPDFLLGENNRNAGGNVNLNNYSDLYDAFIRPLENHGILESRISNIRPLRHSKASKLPEVYDYGHGGSTRAQSSSFKPCNQASHKKQMNEEGPEANLVLLHNSGSDKNHTSRSLERIKVKYEDYKMKYKTSMGISPPCIYDDSVKDVEYFPSGMNLKYSSVVSDEAAKKSSIYAFQSRPDKSYAKYIMPDVLHNQMKEPSVEETSQKGFPISVLTTSYRQRADSSTQAEAVLREPFHHTEDMKMEQPMLRIKPDLKKFHKDTSKYHASREGSMEQSKMNTVDKPRTNYYRGSFNDTRKVLIDSSKDMKRSKEREHRPVSNSRIVVRKSSKSSSPAHISSPSTTSKWKDSQPGKGAELNTSQYEMGAKPLVTEVSNSGFPFFKGSVTVTCNKPSDDSDEGYSRVFQHKSSSRSRTPDDKRKMSYSQRYKSPNKIYQSENSLRLTPTKKDAKSYGSPVPRKKLDRRNFKNPPLISKSAQKGFHDSAAKIGKFTNTNQSATDYIPIQEEQVSLGETRQYSRHNKLVTDVEDKQPPLSLKQRQYAKQENAQKGFDDTSRKMFSNIKESAADCIPTPEASLGENRQCSKQTKLTNIKGKKSLVLLKDQQYVKHDKSSSNVSESSSKKVNERVFQSRYNSEQKRRAHNKHNDDMYSLEPKENHAGDIFFREYGQEGYVDRKSYELDDDGVELGNESICPLMKLDSKSSMKDHFPESVVEVEYAAPNRGYHLKDGQFERWSRSPIMDFNLPIENTHTEKRRVNYDDNSNEVSSIEQPFQFRRSSSRSLSREKSFLKMEERQQEADNYSHQVGMPRDKRHRSEKEDCERSHTTRYVFCETDHTFSGRGGTELAAQSDGNVKCSNKRKPVQTSGNSKKIRKNDWLEDYKLWFQLTLQHILESDKYAVESGLCDPVLYLESITRGNKRSLSYIPKGEPAKQVLKFIAMNKDEMRSSTLVGCSDENRQDQSHEESDYSTSTTSPRPTVQQKQREYSRNSASLHRSNDFASIDRPTASSDIRKKSAIVKTFSQEDRSAKCKKGDEITEKNKILKLRNFNTAMKMAADCKSGQNKSIEGPLVTTSSAEQQGNKIFSRAGNDDSVERRKEFSLSSPSDDNHTKMYQEKETKSGNESIKLLQKSSGAVQTRRSSSQRQQNLKKSVKSLSSKPKSTRGSQHADSRNDHPVMSISADVDKHHNSGADIIKRHIKSSALQQSIATDAFADISGSQSSKIITQKSLNSNSQPSLESRKPSRAGSRIGSLDGTSNDKVTTAISKVEYIEVPENCPIFTAEQERLLPMFKQQVEKIVIQKNLNVLYKFTKYGKAKILGVSKAILQAFSKSYKSANFNIDHAVYCIWSLFEKPSKNILDEIKRRLRRVNLDKTHFDINTETFILFQRTVFNLCYDYLKLKVRYIDQDAGSIRHVRLHSENLFPQFQGESYSLIKLWTWCERMYFLMENEETSRSMSNKYVSVSSLSKYKNVKTLEEKIHLWLKKDLKEPVYEVSEDISSKLVFEVHRELINKGDDTTKQMAVMMIVGVWTENLFNKIQPILQEDNPENSEEEDTSALDDLVILDEVYSDDSDPDDDKVEIDIDVSDDLSSNASVQIDLF